MRFHKLLNLNTKFTWHFYYTSTSLLSIYLAILRTWHTIEDFQSGKIRKQVYALGVLFWQ